MPYKHVTMQIHHTKYDRRIKLSDDDKQEIRRLYGTINSETGEYHSQRSLAKKFRVSRRLITFVLDPEQLKENKKRREERGGTKQYYNKDKWREDHKEHSRYKQKVWLKKKGEHEY